MELTKFGTLVTKENTYLFPSIRGSNISRGCTKILEIPEGRVGKFWGQFWKIQRGGGLYFKSLLWRGMDIFWNHTLHCGLIFGYLVIYIIIIKLLKLITFSLYYYLFWYYYKFHYRVMQSIFLLMCRGRSQYNKMALFHEFYSKLYELRSLAPNVPVVAFDFNCDKTDQRHSF